MPVIAKNTEVAVWLAWNSASIEIKNTPKLYVTPKTTNPAMKAERAANQPARESGVRSGARLGHRVANFRHGRARWTGRFPLNAEARNDTSCLYRPSPPSKRALVRRERLLGLPALKRRPELNRPSKRRRVVPIGSRQSVAGGLRASRSFSIRTCHADPPTSANSIPKLEIPAGVARLLTAAGRRRSRSFGQCNSRSAG